MRTPRTYFPLALALALALLRPAPAQEDQDLPFAHLDPDARITVNFADEDLRSVLEMFSAQYGLNIVMGPEVGGKVTINLFEAPVRQALEKILAANGFAYTTEGNFILVRELPSGQVQGAGGGPSPWRPTALFLNHVRAKDVVPMIQPLLGGDELAVEGPESLSGIKELENLGGNAQATREMVVLFASEETLARVRELLAQVDIPPPQVLVEATILALTLNENFKLGVNFTALGGIDFQALGSTTNVTDQVSGGSPNGPQLQDWLFGATQRGFAESGTRGLHIGILRDQFGVFLEALEEVGQVTVLSNPHVLALNRHPAQVLVGRKLGYQTLTATSTTTIQSVQFLEVGTTLTFRPYVSDDGYVRMEIHPENSDGQVSPTTGLPEESTTEVTTNVVVRSGHTIVIGGLMENELQTNFSQVPILGSLPVIGSLFRSEEQIESRQEIVILLTPHIVGDMELSRRADEARRRFEAAQGQLAATHFGYLRPAYARHVYAEAAAALARGKPEAALAKAEWGLRAMPADPDLAVLAAHCREEVRANQMEQAELREAIELLGRLDRKDQP